MKRLSLVCAATFLFATGGTAYAAQGSYDGYGYQMPRRGAASAPAITGKASKPSKAAAAGQIKKKQNGAGSLTGMKPSLGGGGPAKVNLATGYGAGKIIIDQSAKKLYYTVSSTQAYVYPVAVGKKGFKWTGTKKITKEVNWPDWRPPAEMRERKPNLPELHDRRRKEPARCQGALSRQFALPHPRHERCAAASAPPHRRAASA